MTLTIDWNEFTPLASLLGGALIGLAAVMLVAFKGRILGISGIVGSMLQTSNTPKDHYRWRLYFLCTSGHAVCGLGRLSLRSLTATLVFMGSGFLTAYVFYHLA